MGAGHYRGKRSLKECLKNPPDRIKPLIYEQIEDYQFKLFEVEKENPENYHTELRQFIQVMQARYDKKKLSELFEREDFQNLSTLTQQALAVHLNNNDICKKVIEEGENVCKALRDLEKDWKMEGRQEGRQEGRIEGLELGIRGFVQNEIEEKHTKEEIIAKLVKFFSLTKEKASEYFAKCNSGNV